MPFPPPRTEVFPHPPYPQQLLGTRSPHSLVVWQSRPLPTTGFMALKQEEGRLVYWQMGHKKLRAEGSPSSPLPKGEAQEPGVPLSQECSTLPPVFL